MEITLTESQEEAYDKILSFLVSDQKYFILSGSPGSGKSTLINYMMDTLLSSYSGLCKTLKIQQQFFNIQCTATTNSAADSLGGSKHGIPTHTIHSALNLVMRQGELVQRYPVTFFNSILIVDEYTLIDRVLYDYIDAAAVKVILVGDEDQLLAVKGLARELRNHRADHRLTKSERTKSEDIIKLIEIFQGYVRNVQDPEDIDISGMADVSSITTHEFFDLVDDPSFSFKDKRFITHTNSKSIAINQEIRKARGFPEHFVSGERVILNRYVRKGNENFKTDSEYTVIDTVVAGGFRGYTTMDSWGNTYTMYHHPVDPDHEKCPTDPVLFDLRSMYSSTVYKAQGRSVDTVFIDLDGFPKNVTRDTLVRSLFVGASRARHHVVFVGDLSEHLLRKL